MLVYNVGLFLVLGLSSTEKEKVYVLPLSAYFLTTRLFEKLRQNFD